MKLETRKSLFIQEILKIQNEDIIIGLEKLLQKLKVESFEKELVPMSLEKFYSDIEQSLEDYANGRIIEANELKNEYK
jgi:hypothetical protein